MADDETRHAMSLEQRPQFQSCGQGLLVRAPAKINLSLLIAGKRPDGFHEIETIMAKITYYDEILIEPRPGKGLELICTGPHWAPAGPDNLVLQAAEKLIAETGKKVSARITLRKLIPAGTGLGSASSDAAATLLGLNHHFKLNCSALGLQRHAAQLGSDVPFFLGGPLAFCTGRGEKIGFLHQTFNFQVVLCIPNINISTEKVYKNYQHNPNTYLDLHNQIRTHMRKNRIDLATKMCTNMLANSCFDLCEGLDELKNAIESLIAGPVCLSGSGSALYFVSERDNLAQTIDYVSTIEGTLHCKCVVVESNRW